MRQIYGTLDWLPTSTSRRLSVTLVVRFSETLRGRMDIDITSSSADRIASFGAEPLITGTSDHHGSLGTVGFRSPGALDHDGRTSRAGLADRFAAARHYPLALGGLSGARLRDRKPNHALQATPVGAGLVALYRRPGVPELGR